MIAERKGWRDGECPAFHIIASDTTHVCQRQVARSGISGHFRPVFHRDTPSKRIIGTVGADLDRNGGRSIRDGEYFRRSERPKPRCRVQQSQTSFNLRIRRNGEAHRAQQMVFVFSRECVACAPNIVVIGFDARLCREPVEGAFFAHDRRSGAGPARRRNRTKERC